MAIGNFKKIVFVMIMIVHDHVLSAHDGGFAEHMAIIGINSFAELVAFRHHDIADLLDEGNDSYVLDSGGAIRFPQGDNLFLRLGKLKTPFG